MRFRQKMLLVMVWLLTLAYGIGGTALIFQSFHAALEQEEKSAGAAFQMTLQAVELVNRVDLRRDLKSISTALERVDDADRQLSMRLLSRQQTLYSRGEVFFDGLSGSAMQVFSWEGGRYLAVGSDLRANFQSFRLEVVYDLASVYESRDRQIRTYRRTLAVLLPSGALAAWLASYLLTRPLSQVSKAARRMAKGELGVRVKLRSRDELGELGSDFNHMAGRIQENVAQLQEAFARQERFMGSFAHELKTPMTSIIGYADLMRAQALDEAEQQEAADYIFSEGKRLEALSLKLLDLLVLKKEPTALQEQELGTLLSPLVRHLAPVYAQKGIRLQAKWDPGVWPMDPDLMGSCLMNLIDNARKALDQGGNIYVLGDFPEGHCRIRVLDNGRGMPQAAIDHLTEAFYRVDKARSRAQGGAGLGLTLCNEIVRLHGGELRFDSREGNGTCVTILLGRNAP